eukprot:scaffold680443_cov71-Attheya_sp.AAC.1
MFKIRLPCNFVHGLVCSTTRGDGGLFFLPDFVVSDVAVVVGGAWLLVASVLAVWLVAAASAGVVCKFMVEAVPGDDCATEIVAGGAGGCGTTDAASVSVTAGGEQGWQNDDRFHSRDGSDLGFIRPPCPPVSAKFRNVRLDFLDATRLRRPDGLS